MTTLSKAEIGEEYARLTYQQKVMFTAYIKKELADAVLITIRRLLNVVETGKNEQAVTSAGRQLIQLSEKYGVLKTDSLEEFTDSIMSQMQDQSG